MSYKENCKGNVIGKKNGFEIIDCVHCGFAHISPIPNEENLNTIYTEEYYVEDKPSYIKGWKKIWIGGILFMMSVLKF